MNKIAVFFHTRISGGGMHTENGYRQPGINGKWGRYLFLEQLSSIRESGLADNCEKLFIGVNGHQSDVDFVAEFAPQKAWVVGHGKFSESLLPTIRMMQSWLPEHEDWYVCFFHAKGASHPQDGFTKAWRDCMTRHVILNWRRCVNDLDAGYESVGCHWLKGNSEEKEVWFWGGVFFWAKAQYLLTLPKVSESDPKTRHGWYEPEHWIGSAQLKGVGRLPRVKDYAPHWPSYNPCTISAI